MKKFIASAVIAATVFTFSATSASAFTAWKSFEAQGHDVKARYTNGELRFIKATNKATGEVYTGRVTPSGIAFITRPDNSVARIDVNEAEKRFDNTTTMQDLAQVD